MNTEAKASQIRSLVHEVATGALRVIAEEHQLSQQLQNEVLAWITTLNVSFEGCCSWNLSDGDASRFQVFDLTGGFLPALAVAERMLHDLEDRVASQVARRLR